MGLLYLYLYLYLIIQNNVTNQNKIKIEKKRYDSCRQMSVWSRTVFYVLKGCQVETKYKLCTCPTRKPILRNVITCLHDVSMNEQWLYRLPQKREHHIQPF